MPAISSIRTSIALLALLTASAFAAPKKPADAGAPYHPAIDPANFTHVVNIPFFPLVPGTTATFIEKEGSESRENKVTVTHDTKTIMGVKCVVVRDTVSVGGVVKEDTFDWYAQDKEGAVWYFGEDTKEFEKGGLVNTGGSWEAGVNGQPGIIMPANPKPGEPYRQEYSPGNAEDMGQVIAIDETTTVPHGTFKHCVKTKDWSMLESGHEHKWYARGVGVVRAESSDGEVSTLVSVTKE